jgi:hypothetical protein
MNDNSLKVVEFDFIHSFFKNKDYFFIGRDKAINEYGDIGCNDYPKSIVTKTGVSGSNVTFNATISGNLLKNPIYIFDHESCQYWDKGYQEVENFNFEINFELKLMYIFAPKKIANSFLNKLNSDGFITYTVVNFDFSKISDLVNKKSAWGIWKNSEGIIKRIAEFGKDIEKAIDDYSNITTLYMDYYYHDRGIQIIMGLDSRLATPNKVTKDELIGIYNEISVVLRL